MRSSSLRVLVGGALLILATSWAGADENSGPPEDRADFVSAAEFGLLELQPGEDATPVFRRALEACRERAARGLRIPSGEWALHPDQAFEQYLFPANNDSGLKRVVFLLDGLSPFTIAGDGARLVCHGSLIPFSATNSRGLVLRGFTVDWARPFSLQARVTSVDAATNSFELAVAAESVYEIRGQRLVFREKPSRTPNSWLEWAPPVAEDVAWERNLLWNVWFDAATRRPLLNERAWALHPDTEVHEVRPGVVRLVNALPKLPTPDMVLVVNGMQSPNRTSPAISLDACTDVRVEDVTVHHAGGMGLVAQRCTNVTLTRYNVLLPPGKDRYVTTTADATHFNGCRGQIVLEDCQFENMLDDATNVHGCYAKIERRIDERTLLCRRRHSMQRGLVVFTQGDTARLVNSADLQPLGDARVAGVTEINSDFFEVRLESPLPKDLPALAALYNRSWQPAVVVRGCTVRNNRGRSMLIATAGHVVIEGNRFERSSMSGIQFEGDNGYWWESGPAESVEILDNEFDHVGGPVLNFVPQIDAQRYPQALYHGGVRFARNRVIHLGFGELIAGVAVDGLQVVENQFRQGDDTPLDNPLRLVRIASGRNIVIQDNRWTGDLPVVIDVSQLPPDTLVGENVGFEVRGK
jgi:hypothetical protein